MKAHVNLLIADLFGEDQFPYHKVVLPGAFLVLILAILGGTVVEFGRSKSIKQEIDELNTRRTTITQSLGSLRSEAEEVLRQAQSASEGAKTREQLLRQLEQERIPWFNLMREISFLIPDDVWLNSMEGVEDLNGGKSPDKNQITKGLRLKGFAASHTAIMQWMSALEGSRYFKQVRLVFTQKDVDEKQARVTFEMMVLLR
jgi:Tfp pilus assembly protein PilN